MRLPPLGFWFLLGILLGCFEAAVIPFFPRGWNSLRIVLPFLVFLVFVERTPRAIALALGSGIILDLFFIGEGSFASARFLLIVFILQFLGTTILTNHSLYVALVLTLCAGMIDALVRIASGTLGGFSEFWLHVLIDSVFVIGCMFVRSRIFKSFYARSTQVIS